MLAVMSGSRYRGRRRGVPIRDGSVRQAREEAGLSLADLAGDSVTRTAIHYIERGRTKPSWETLQLIARRTRRPIEYFLLPAENSLPAVDDGEIRQLERLTLSQRFGEVIELGSRALGKRWERHTLALIHFYLGQAYCRLVRPHDALHHLRLARTAFEKQRDEWMAVEALDWEASALGLLEDPLAIDQAHDALRRCRELSPKARQIESRILGHIASIYVASESWAQAARYYEAALHAAGEVRDLLQLAKMHHGLGTVCQRMMQPSIARQHFDKAIALYTVENDRSSLYRVENDLGFLLLRVGQFDGAEQHLMQALSGCEVLGIDRRGRGNILVNIAELKLRMGHLESARDYLSQALHAGEAVGERIVLAEAYTILGELDEKYGNQQAADTHFETALATLRELAMADRLRDCHMKYAEVLHSRGDLARAAGQWRAAAEVARMGAAGLRVPASVRAAGSASPA